MLGSHLVAKLRSLNGDEVLPLSRKDADLRQQGAFSSILQAFRPDVVIHTAAKVGGIRANMDNPTGFLLENLQIDTNVISASLEHGVKDFLYVGSSCMYPKDYRQPLQEIDLLQAPLEPTNEGYALAKIAGAKLCEYVSDSMGLNYRTIIPSNLYGPGDNFDPNSSHMLPSAIRKIHQARLDGKREVGIWGSGAARREYTYVVDLANWLVGALPRLGNFPTLLNVGVNLDFTIREFYETVMKVLDYEVELLTDTSRPDGMMSKLMSSRYATDKLGWSPSTSLEDGIANTYAWFLDAQMSS